MNQNNGKVSRFSSNENCESTQKRRKLNPVDTPSLSSSGQNSGDINQMFREMSDRLEAVKDIVSNQAAVDKQTIRELQSSLEEARASARNLHDEKVEISKKNVEMRRRNIELWNRNTELADDLASMTQTVATEKLKRIDAEKNVELQKIELRQTRERIEEVTSQRTYLWREIQELLSKAARADQLEKDLKSLRDAAAQQEKNSKDLELQETSQGAILEVQELEPMTSRVTRAALKKNHYHLIEEDEHEVLENGKGGLEGMSDLINIGESSSDEDENSSGSDDTDNNADKVIESAAETKDGEQELKITMGKYYGLVSDRTYFEIDWKKESESLGGGIFRCKRCSYRGKTGFIKDHIYCQHYGGKFLCGYCRNPGSGYSWPNGLRRHIAKKHSSVL